MQGGVAGQVRIRIGAGVEQLRRELEVPVHHRREERRGAGRQRTSADRPTASAFNGNGLVDVGARLQQHAHDVAVSFAGCEEERRHAGGEPRLEAGADLDQHLHDRRVAFGRRPHQRGLLVLLVRAVHLRAAPEERFDRGERPDARGRHQRRFAAGQRRVRVGAGAEQRLDHRAVGVGDRERERRDAVAVRRADVGAGAEQQLDALDIVLIRGPVERGHPVHLRRVDVGAALQERADRRAVQLLHRVRERRVPLRRR